MLLALVSKNLSSENFFSWSYVILIIIDIVKLKPERLFNNISNFFQYGAADHDQYICLFHWFYFFKTFNLFALPSR